MIRRIAGVIALSLTLVLMLTSLRTAPVAGQEPAIANVVASKMFE